MRSYKPNSPVQFIASVTYKPLVFEEINQFYSTYQKLTVTMSKLGEDRNLESLVFTITSSPFCISFHDVTMEESMMYLARE